MTANFQNWMLTRFFGCFFILRRGLVSTNKCKLGKKLSDLPNKKSEINGTCDNICLSINLYFKLQRFLLQACQIFNINIFDN